MLKHRPIMLKKAIHRLIVKRKRMIAKRLTGNIAKIEGLAILPRPLCLQQLFQRA